MKTSTLADSSSRLLFDEFELLPGGELLRDGVAVKLQPQPAKVLELLASRTGEVVSREEIRQAVWGDSFVDFDASLNFCIKQIRRALDDSATEPRYVETVPKRGYRFLQPVRTGPSPAASVSEAVREPAPAAAPPIRWPRVAGLGAAALALLLVIFLVGSRQIQKPFPKPRLAVLPLSCDTGDPADSQVCGGISDALAGELTRQLPGEIGVIGAMSIHAYGKSQKSPLEIAKDLEATHVFTGTAVPSDRKLRIDARLLRASGGTPVWEETFESDLADVPLLYEQMVRGLARALRIPPPATEPLPATRPPEAAYEAYLRGIYLLRQQQPVEAEKSLEEAVRLAPEFAPGHAGLAEARFSARRGADPVEAAARRALELDPRLARAHLAQAQILMFYRYDWERSGREYQRALALSPGDSNIHYSYSLYLAGLGRLPEAFASLRRAQELDPASVFISSDLGWFLYLDRRYAEAMEQVRRTLELLEIVKESLPENRAVMVRFMALRVKLYSSLQLGDDAAALEAANGLAAILQGEETRVAPGTAKELVAWFYGWLREQAKTQPQPNYLMTLAAATAGDYPGALDLLEQGCKNHEPMLVWAGVEPGYDPLRGDPRFARVLECIRLPADAPARRRAVQ